jgi:hypothetical protein
MSATISSPVVQPAFGLGNPNIGSVVSIQRPAVGPAATEDVKMFADKGFVSHLGRTAMIAGVAATVLTSVGPSAAVAAPATKEKGLMAAGTSEPPTSAPSAATIAAAIIVAVAQRPLPRLPASLAPGSPLRPPIPAATPIMTPTAITAARASPTTRPTPTTMVAAPITAATGPECPIIGGIRSPAGNQNSRKRPRRPPLAGGKFRF